MTSILAKIFKIKISIASLNNYCQKSKEYVEKPKVFTYEQQCMEHFTFCALVLSDFGSHCNQEVNHSKQLPFVYRNVNFVLVEDYKYDLNCHFI